MNTIIHAQKREVGKRSVMSALRNNGFVPAIVYGYQIKSTSIAINVREFEKTLRSEGKNALVTLDIEGNQIKAVVNNIQRDTIKDKLMHLDFLAVDMSKLIGIEVPVILKGQAIGVKGGGVLHQPNRTVKLIVKPTEIPENIEVDVSGLEIGKSLTIGDIRNQIKHTIAGDDQILLVSVSAPTVSIELEGSVSENASIDADKAV
ncbi:50S ribosomal protein L25/general stress protein Ctc [Rummeliibacillus pycnus]|uniref:50S ribosomal protein L25/general stress protein Ctc n=1 Tax=Rummeliibacillus pycnus TaxID=101070 RepID=UPI003D27F2E9